MMMRPPISGVIFNERGKPMATIEVTLAVSVAGVEAKTVTADGVEVSGKNPQAATQDDSVKWVFISGPDDLHVVFKKVELPNSSGVLLIYEQGPFSRPLSMIGNQISGTIAPDAPNGRYLYDIHDGNNKSLKWSPPLNKNQNFGGLDVPKPPPG